MAGPPWLAATFAATMLAVAGYCASRLVVSRLWRRVTELDGDGVHVLMGVAMAGMLVPRLNPLGASAWEVVFGFSAMWFGWQAAGAYRGRVIGSRRCPHPVPHLVESAAMLYMFLAASITRSGRPVAAMGPTSAGSSAPFPALVLGLALFMIGYVVWTADRISPLKAAPGLRAAPGPQAAAGARGELHAPRATPASVAAASARAAAATAHDTGAAPGAASSAGAAAASPHGTVAGTGAAPGAIASVGFAAAGTGVAARWRAGTGALLAPRCAACCKIAMGVTMGYMLIVML
jgi:hypothetical protein